MTQALDLEITDMCNNRCVFCATHRQISPLSLQEIRFKLLKAKEQGFDRIDLSGGEPTIHKDIYAIVNSAKRLGFPTIYFKTNGRRLKDIEFTKRLLEMGANEFLVSFHGPNAEIHDAQTDVPGSFAEAFEGTKNLVKLGAKVATLTVISTINHPYLRQTVQVMFDDLGVSTHNFAFAYPIASAYFNFDRIVPRYADVKEPLREALEFIESRDKPTTVDNVPLCYMPGFEQYANFMNKNDPSHPPHEFGPLCPECIYWPICEGVPTHYITCRRWDEFEPIRKQKEAPLPQGEEKEIPLQGDWVFTPVGIYCQKCWGGVLHGPKGAAAVTRRGFEVYLCADGKTSLNEVKEKFGAAAVNFLFSLKERFFMSIAPREMVASWKPFGVAFKSTTRERWQRPMVETGDEVFEFPLYEPAPPYRQVRLLGQAGL